MNTEASAPSFQMGASGPAPIPGMYMNSFKLGVTTSDVFIVLQHNGADVAVLNISFTLAKTLAEGLKMSIEQLEQKSGQSIMNATTIAGFLFPTAEQHSK